MSPSLANTFMFQPTDKWHLSNTHVYEDNIKIDVSDLGYVDMN
jgi:hypothetical protein